MGTRAARWLLLSLGGLATFALDWASKSWANSTLTPGVSSPFIPGLLCFTLTTNTGGAFGIGREHALLMTCLASLLFVGVFIWFVARDRSACPPGALEVTGIAFVLGGAAGNLFDRLTRGRVTDFIEFAFISFPVFNVADAMIDVGAVLIVLSTWARKPEVESGEHEAN